MESFKERLERKGILKEGKYVKHVDDKLVNGLLKNVILPKVEKPDLSKFTDEELQAGDPKVLSAGTSNEILRELTEKYVATWSLKNGISDASDKWKSGEEYKKLSDYGTGLMAINLMREMNLKTTPMSNVDKFEKELDKYIQKHIR